MSNKCRNFDEIPASACTLVVGQFELGDNGDNAKTSPIKMVARSGQPIEHWFWGNVVHDLAGMHMHKSRIPVDYVHDAKEIIGYLNHFDSESGDLVASGALVPFKDSDRATEIIHKSKEGVPYEASINFGGDGIKVEDVPEGAVAQVNGYQFEGPGVIVREWPLRGVAVCPYGADMNTESAMAFSNNKQVFSASVSTDPEAQQDKGSAMSESIEVEPKVEDTAVVELSEQTDETVDTSKVEELAAVEAEPVETEVLAEEPPTVVEDEPTELSREDFLRIDSEFGSDVAAQTVRDGGTYASALLASHEALKAENAALKANAQELSESKGGKASKVVAESKKAGSLFKTGK